MGKGVRQGDPLSPYLFILAAEGLAAIMKEAQNANIFNGVRVNNSVEEVSLFQFADDAIFVGDWSFQNAKNLLRVLKCFEICSGLKINLSKSRLSGVKVSREEVTCMARRLNCKEESIPFSYLGLPVGGNMRSAKNWQPLIDKFRSKLTVWKAKTLSIGGRYCLCKSVLGALGTYMFSLYKAPKKVLNILESYRSRFLWGDTSENKKIHWMAWDKVMRDKYCGGLGIGSLRALNLALLTKWRWKDKTEVHAKWNRIVKGCSISNSNHGIWNTIQGVDKDLNEMGINVHTFLKPSEDGLSWVWELEPCNKFTVRSMRKLIDGVSLPVDDKETEWIRWLPSKSNIHLWRVLHNRLPTLDNLTKRGVNLPSSDCPLCNIGTESLDHVMTSCSTARTLHAHMANWLGWWPNNELSIADLWGKITSAGVKGVAADICKIIGVAFLITMWKARNDKVFKGEVANDIEIAREVQTVAFNWVRCRSKDGKFLKWENWLCNPVNAVTTCNILASC